MDKEDYRKICDDIDEGREDPDSLQTYLTPWPKYLNVYRVTQSFGGREEGGWWYDCGEPLESLLVDNEEQYNVLLDILKKRYHLIDLSGYSLKNNPDHRQYDIERVRGRSSCAGGHDIIIKIEYQFAQEYPRSRPRYE